MGVDPRQRWPVPMRMRNRPDRSSSIVPTVG
jgi:hypothetical protein